ncbi:hypothetical protein GSI_05842 [Ganoderma sinense ZZ0214-1]|uniref:HNH nuclease domain-containing protein n=1 Tax=Ganoderma sinense ZZ0214-1 TaxID=1077348 RepID=A0A2G8SBK1_9APHY|nr:hypothetical protein GSI_05842 [Ganoderma sinense ZZ0214-1]
MNIREPLSAPEPQEIFCAPDVVRIIHPRHEFPPLLHFPAFSTGSPTTPYGVSRFLLLDACRVLTNHAANYQEDFLASDSQGEDRLEINDTPLNVNCYYFLGPPEVEANRDYPIVKSLSALRFPSVLPAHWARIAERRPPRPYDYRISPEPSMMTDLVRRRDRVCTITACPDATQCAHLIPKADEAWFLANHMSDDYIGDYNNMRASRTSDIDHPANGILLRADVRLCLDSHAFVFYPADCTGELEDGTFVAYFVDEGYKLLPDVIHRRPVAIPQDVPVEFLYARFAHTIISLRYHNPMFSSVPDLPMVEVIRRRLQELAQKEAQEALDASSEGSGEDWRWCVVFCYSVGTG